MRKLFALAVLVSSLMLALPPAPTTADASAQRQPETELQYAAKFVCGRIDGRIAAPGQYFTIVNVHNPSPNRTVEFRKKFARALPDEKAGKITRFFEAALRADEAMGIDCPNMYEHTGITPGTFVEGYVVIQTPMELDVVAVYTAGAPNVSTLHTERVPPRRIPYVAPTAACADLNQDLSTGVGPWRIRSDPDPSTSPEPRTASLITTPHALWSSVTGGRWIGPKTNSNTNFGGVAGRYTYEVCFCLCRGFTNARLTMRGIADDGANVFLNGQPLGTLGGSPGPPRMVQTGDQSFFVAGTNCLTVDVTNSVGPTGLDMTGSVTATAGMCPANTTGETNNNPNSQ